MRDRPERRGEVVQAEGAAGWTIYEPSADTLHLLNASAKAIWDLCDGQTSPSEMAAAISELTGVDPAQAESDVRETLIRLRDSRLVD
ncbi:MAG TPA: PqqD family protein [Acidimicrobiia bacterium]|nr:PqqD family protein [Acidimicrobiia bacterium]